MIIKKSFFSNPKNRSKEERFKYVNRSGAGLVPSKSYISYGSDYWDNPNLPMGYGGYVYDGRFAKNAKEILSYLNLTNKSKMLEIGCSRGFLMVEFDKLGISIKGIDISRYAIDTAHPLVAKNIKLVDASHVDIEGSYDVIICKDTLPHIKRERLPFLLTNINNHIVEGGCLIVDIKVAESNSCKELTARFDPTQLSILCEAEWCTLIERYIDKDVYASFSELF